jgi:molybdopterin molybdotransferase
MSLLPVEEALAHILAGIERPVEAELAPLRQCAGQTLAEDVRALRTQPPFPASAMDGYAVRAQDVAAAPIELRLVGRSVAGAGFAGSIGTGEAVRIFTGAPVPPGADAVVIQENAEESGGCVAIQASAPRGQFVRPAGLDFNEGDVLLDAGRRLDACALALAAAMGHAVLPVRRRPRVAILATGDELVLPGEAPRPDQIVASNLFAIAAIVEKAGGEAIDLGIARDTVEALDAAAGAAETARADMLVTLGGASVGDHDLIQEAFGRRGMQLGFWRVALRPGKPMIHGRLGPMLVLGLPGNPVSSIVCGVLFVAPAIRALLGDPAAAEDPTEPAILGRDLPENDHRQDYLRARLMPAAEGLPIATAFETQDSSMLALLARSEALLVRPPLAPPGTTGDLCRIVRLNRFF